MKKKDFIQTLLEIQAQLKIIEEQNREMKIMLHQLYTLGAVPPMHDFKLTPPWITTCNDDAAMSYEDIRIKYPSIEIENYVPRQGGWSGPLPKNVKDLFLEASTQMQSLIVRNQPVKYKIQHRHRKTILKALKLNF